MNVAIEIATEKPLLTLTLPNVANRAGVSVQTVLRQFGSRDSLLDAATESATARIVAERAAVPGDVPTAIRTLFDHYELRGDGVLLLLAQERWEPRAAKITAAGRRLHRDWVTGVFGPFLAKGSATERGETTDLLVIATDVYTWKILRRDQALARPEAESRVHRLIGNILEGI
jgi:AcrR family transcriptional regulator